MYGNKVEYNLELWVGALNLAILLYNKISLEKNAFH